MPGQSALGGRWWLWSMVATITTIALTFAAFFVVLRLATEAHAQRPIITGWLAANADCKSGPADDPKNQSVREARRDWREAEAQRL